jgi:hypothetical protein
MFKYGEERVGIAPGKTENDRAFIKPLGFANFGRRYLESRSWARFPKTRMSCCPLRQLSGSADETSLRKKEFSGMKAGK